MANRLDFYFKQKVTKGDLNWSFQELERAIWRTAKFSYGLGIIEGGLLSQVTPAAEKAVMVEDFMLNDRQGRHVEMESSVKVDCELDFQGTSTYTDLGAGQGRWITVFAGFKRELAEPKKDGNDVTVLSKMLDFYELFVVRGPIGYVDGGGDLFEDEAFTTPLERPERPDEYTGTNDFRPDALVLGDIKVTEDEPVILEADIDYSRREDWIREEGFDHIAPAALIAGTPKEGLLAFATWLNDYLGGMSVGGFWANIGANDGQSYKNGTLSVTGDPTAKKVVEKLISDLADASSATTNGAWRIGISALKFGNFGWDGVSSVYNGIKYILETLNSDAGADKVGHTTVTGSNGHVASGSGSVQTAIGAIVNEVDSKIQTLLNLIGNNTTNIGNNTTAIGNNGSAITSLQNTKLAKEGDAFTGGVTFRSFSAGDTRFDDWVKYSRMYNPTVALSQLDGSGHPYWFPLAGTGILATTDTGKWLVIPVPVEQYERLESVSLGFYNNSPGSDMEVSGTLYRYAINGTQSGTPVDTSTKTIEPSNNGRMRFNGPTYSGDSYENAGGTYSLVVQVDTLPATCFLGGLRVNCSKRRII